MHAANDNAGIDWAAPVRPSNRDIFDSMIRDEARAANDNTVVRLSPAELFRLLGEGLSPQ